jgi:hypothetical protein
MDGAGGGAVRRLLLNASVFQLDQFVFFHGFAELPSDEYLRRLWLPALNSQQVQNRQKAPFHPQKGRQRTMVKRGFDLPAVHLSLFLP